jgi:hypothetical protein
MEEDLGKGKGGGGKWAGAREYRRARGRERRLRDRGGTLGSVRKPRGRWWGFFFLFRFFFFWLFYLFCLVGKLGKNYEINYGFRLDSCTCVAMDKQKK